MWRSKLFLIGSIVQTHPWFWKSVLYFWHTVINFFAHFLIMKGVSLILIAIATIFINSTIERYLLVDVKADEAETGKRKMSYLGSSQWYFLTFSINNKIFNICDWIVEIDALHQRGYRNLPMGVGMATYFTESEIGPIPTTKIHTAAIIQLLKNYVRTKLSCLKRNQKQLQSLVPIYSHSILHINDIGIKYRINSCWF